MRRQPDTNKRGGGRRRGKRGQTKGKGPRGRNERIKGTSKIKMRRSTDEKKWNQGKMTNIRQKRRIHEKRREQSKKERRTQQRIMHHQYPRSKRRNKTRTQRNGTPTSSFTSSSTGTGAYRSRGPIPSPPEPTLIFGWITFACPVCGGGAGMAVVHIPGDAGGWNDDRVIAAPAGVELRNLGAGWQTGTKLQLPFIIFERLEPRWTTLRFHVPVFHFPLGTPQPNPSTILPC
jgi:hypothetical protein